jgi:antirestriction protein ArdC
MKNGTVTESATTSRDLYQEMTNRIIAMIEKGVAPWRRTWSVYGLARNYVTGHIYTGINMILMNNTGHAVPYFMTYNQIQEKGGRLFHGAKANMVIYYMVYYKDINDMTLTKEEAILRKNRGGEIQVLSKRSVNYILR